MDYVELVVLTTAAVMSRVTLEWRITRNRSGKRRSPTLREGIYQIKISSLRITRTLHCNNRDGKTMKRPRDRKKDLKLNMKDLFRESLSQSLLMKSLAKQRRKRMIILGDKSSPQLRESWFMITLEKVISLPDLNYQRNLPLSQR
jgi:hypothetical protein